MLRSTLCYLVFTLGLYSTAWAAPNLLNDRPVPAQAAKNVATQGVQRFKLAAGVSLEEAVESMKLRANQLNFKLVADLPLSEQVAAMGKKSRYMRILAFCDALIASQMVSHDLLFAAFLPCRIAVVQDAQGQGWLVTMHLDQILHGVNLPPHLRPLAQQVRDTMYNIIEAGVNGDL